MRRKVYAVLSLLCFLIPALAQDRGLGIRGKITDETGVLVSGVKVLVTSEDGFSRLTVTNAGNYSVSEVPPGRYRVVAGLPEFEPGIKQTEVTATSSGIVDFTLKPQAQFPPVGPCPGPGCFLESFAAFVKPKNLKSELASLVQTEREFAALSVRNGTRAAFLANFSPRSIIFRTNAVLGQTWFENNPSPKGELSWKPAFADISSTADFGYTTGPWEFRLSSDQAPTASGHYVTVWQRQPEGRWTIAVDIGISHEAVTATEEVVFGPIGNQVTEQRSRNQMESAGDGLLQKERTFLMSPENHASALGEDVRLYRDGKLPISGPSASRTASGRAGDFLWTIPSITMSSSTEFAYAYGKVYSDSTIHNYLRIWKRQPQAAWRIVVDLVD